MILIVFRNCNCRTVAKKRGEIRFAAILDSPKGLKIGVFEVKYSGKISTQRWHQISLSRLLSTLVAISHH